MFQLLSLSLSLFLANNNCALDDFIKKFLSKHQLVEFFLVVVIFNCSLTVPEDDGSLSYKVLDFRGVAPASVDPAAISSAASTESPLFALVPTMLKGLRAAHTQWGSL
jgi:hypothetical protein